MRDLPILKFNLKTPEKFGNLAERLDHSDRRTMASGLIELINIDATSMSDWLGKAKGYLDKVESKGDAAPQNQEQSGSNDTPPPTTELTLAAVIQFSARATDAILGEPDLARASEESGAALAAWVSSQLRTADPNWTLDTDPLVVHMGVTGLAWRKRNFDDDDEVFHSHFLTCEDVIINKSVRAIERAPRITHQFERYPYEIERSIERGKWIDYEPRYNETDPQAPKKFYELDAWLDLDGDGINEPWTVVISRDDIPEIVRIRPRWSAKTVVYNDDVLYFNAIRRFYPYRFLPDPKGGFFPIGFGELLHRCEGNADRLLASIVDTAKTESENGGILGGSQFGLPDKIEVKGNRITAVPTEGQPLSQIFQPWPTKTVSAGSVAALEKIITLGDRLAGTLNVLENAPASMTATMAKGIIDTGTQIQSAVHRRLVASMTQEFRMFVQMADAYGQLPPGMLASSVGGVAVTADPQLATEMQRSALASIYMELMKDPLTNAQEVRMRLYRVLRLPDPEKLLGQPQNPQPTPFEKIDGLARLTRAQSDMLKTKAGVAVQLTQALKNLVDAGGGMIDNRATLLQMAQLETVVQQLVEGATNVGMGLDGMAQQQGNGGPAGPVTAPQDINGPVISQGPASDAVPAGPGPTMQ